MTAVSKIRPHLNGLRAPDELHQLQGWLVWRYEAQDDASAKPRKVPYYAAGGKRHGVQGSPEDRAHLVTFEAARAAAARRGFDGVGLALMPEFGIAALDFDDCVTPGGVHPQVLELVCTTYAEFSPSGRGVRAFVMGNLGDQKSHGLPFGFETFSCKGYVTFTGNGLPHVAGLDLIGPSVAPASPALARYCAQRFGQRPGAAPQADDDPLMTYSPPLGLSEAQLREALEALPGDLGYDQWVQVGMALHHETGGEGFGLWDEWSRASPKYSSREYGEERWRSFGRGGGRAVTARTLVKLANAHGARINVAADLISQGELAPVDPGKAPMFVIQPAWEFMVSRPLRWLLKGLLPQADVGAVYGASGAGKSFLVIDIAIHVARGLDWRGFKCKQADVLYVAAEGAAGVMQRLRAHCSHHGYDMRDVPLRVLSRAPNILKADQVQGLAQSIKAQCGGNTRLIIIDTLAQVTPGANENSSEDMGRAMAHCQAIAHAAGAMVLLVAHAGKDGERGLRGWSGIKGALDVEIAVVKEGRYHGATISKMKDGTHEGMELPFALQTVSLEPDEDGDPQASAVLAGQAQGRQKLPPKGKNQQLVLEVLTAITDLSGTPTEAELLDASTAKMPESQALFTRRQRAKSALAALVAEGYVKNEQGNICIYA